MIKTNKLTEEQRIEEEFLQQISKELKTKKHIQKFENLPDNENFINWNYKGVDYLFPKKQSKHKEISQFEITTTHDTFIFKNHILFIDKKESDSSQLIFSLENDYSFDKNTACICIYRKGVSEPIAHQEKTEYGNVSIRFRSDLFAVNEEYFIVISNFNPMTHKEEFDQIGEYYIYSFNVYTKGEQITPPSIKEVISEISPTPSAYSNTPLSLTIRLKDTTPDIKLFEAVCIDKDQSVVDKCSVTINRRRKVRLSFDTKLVWTPGDYTILVQVNGLPYYKISYSITDKEINQFYWEYINNYSDDFLLCKMLYNANEEWQHIQSIKGAKQLRKAIVNYSPLVEINSNRIAKSMKARSFVKNFTIANDYATIREKTVRKFANCLSNNLMAYNSKDCSSLGKPTEQDLASGSYKMEYNISISENDCHCLYNIKELSSPYSVEFVDNLIEEMQQVSNYAVIIVGSENEISAVFEAHPRLNDYFPKQNRLKTEPLTSHEVIECILKNIEDRNIGIPEWNKKNFLKQYFMHTQNNKLKKLKVEDIAYFVSTNVLNRYTERIRKVACTIPRDKYLTDYMIPEDIDLSLLTNSNDKFDYAIELNKMVGLNKLKSSLEKMFNLTKFNQMRHSFGLKAEDNGCHHMIFTGNPGTGKTTVAKLIGKVFHSIGILSKGDVVITERSKIVGRYLGETEQNMNEILKQAKGNVLFIDEAYTLSTDADDNRDFGRRAIETLLTVLSQKNPDMIIILAGYENEIDRMLKVNQGLNGRFPHRFNFDDYSADELMQIAELIIKDEQYTLTSDAHTQLKESIVETVKNKDCSFSNARWVSQYVTNGIIPEVANRLIRDFNTITQETCQTITLDDVNSAYNNFKIKPSVTTDIIPRVGFKIA